MKQKIPEFLSECMVAVNWNDYGLVGFSSCFNQNLASMALAARIKEEFPELPIVLGGANADGPMGPALLKAFPQVDFVFSGEADVTFPPFAEAVLRGASPPPMPGVSMRGLALPPAKKNSTLGSLDGLPYPAFDDFFQQADALGLISVFGRQLPVEASRGCWWGEKHHCTFCGLNGESMAFRSKGAARMIEEVQYLRERHDCSRFAFTDNILSYRYFNDFLPELARRQWDLDLFFEVKANLPPNRMRLLADAGVKRIQPGIESLSTHVLQLMRKGTTALQNIECLKACEVFGVQPIWSHLYGFPGELLEDYQQVLEITPMLHHLEPPGSLNLAVVQRFAPFFDDSLALGIRNVRPHHAYASVFPFEPALVRDLAYFFEDDRNLDPQLSDLILGPLSDAIGRWRSRHERRALLTLIPGSDASIVVDTRGEKPIAWILEQRELALLNAFERPSALERGFERLTARDPRKRAARNGLQH